MMDVGHNEGKINIKGNELFESNQRLIFKTHIENKRMWRE
jgi:hypothetical protein